MGLFKQAILTGIGLALLAKDEVQSARRKKKMAEQHGEQYLKDLQEMFDRLQGRMEARVEKAVKDIIAKLDIATGEEMAQIRNEIGELRAAIAQDRQVEK